MTSAERRWVAAARLRRPAPLRRCETIPAHPRWTTFFAKARDASRLPLASRRSDAVVKAYDIDSIVGADVKTSSRYVLVAPGGKRDVGDSTTTASTVLSRKQQRHAKRRANSSASVASDAPTERDFGEIEFRELLDQPDAIPEEGEELDLERLRIASEDSEALDAEFFGA